MPSLPTLPSCRSLSAYLSHLQWPRERIQSPPSNGNRKFGEIAPRTRCVYHPTNRECLFSIFGYRRHSSNLRFRSLRLCFASFFSRVNLTPFVCVTVAISMAFVESYSDATSRSCELSSHHVQQDSYMLLRGPNDHGVATDLSQIPGVEACPPSSWYPGFSGGQGNFHRADGSVIHSRDPIHVSPGAANQPPCLFDSARSRLLPIASL